MYASDTHRLCPGGSLHVDAEEASVSVSRVDQLPHQGVLRVAGQAWIHHACTQTLQTLSQKERTPRMLLQSRYSTQG